MGETFWIGSMWQEGFNSQGAGISISDGYIQIFDGS